MNKIHFIFYQAFKKTFICSLFLFSTTIFSQSIGINTVNPLGIFHVDGKRDNSKIPSPAQQLNDFIITNDGNIGIGTIYPKSKLHISSTSNPLKIEGLTEGSQMTNKILLIDENNIVKKSDFSGIPPFPTSAFFYLEKSIPNFLDNISRGKARVVPMAMQINIIEGLTYDEQNSTITFPKGVYEISFTFDTTQSETCAISSYFIDFPFENTFTKIHRTSSQVKLSSHANTITATYVTSVPEGKTWKIELGRGPSGDCEGKTKLILHERRTNIFIYKLPV